ncbi:hypothetical protein JKF63_02905 [Porcisia hertigi]|uniref:SDH assembly factor 2 n=1 Tax=Porcisia hertigi TaxID=2761500 RepID=A0A836L530_9TRYP|nr:hypothetical protein JKF63_02905 [Porcisia hertigi]
MLQRLALLRGAGASVDAIPFALTITGAPAMSVSQRWCSDKASSTSTNPFASSVAKTLRERVFTPDFTSMKAASPKEMELLRKWRAGDGTLEQSLRHPETPGTAGSSDVQSGVTEGSRNVAELHGAMFRDSRPIDPDESVVCKRRRLIYQSRYRGMVEMDLVFGHFARCKLETLDASLLDEYDFLLKQLDSELFRWLVMGVDAPAEVANLRCFDELRRFIQEERVELLGSC